MSEIDFNDLDVSRWAKYLAIDKDGEVWEYSRKPKPMKRTSMWDVPSFMVHIKRIGKITPPKDWTTELYDIVEYEVTE